MLGSMVRWEPNARDRLQEAALALFAERGYDDTTVAEIAERAGLTERTFFRHFADKREVLFGGGHELQELVVSGTDNAAETMAPIDAAVAGFEAAGREFFVAERQEFSRRRQAIIVANPELQERELIKLASLSAALTEALRRRGLGDEAATLTAEIASSIFKTAFARWINEADGRDFPRLIREAVEQLKALTAT